MIKYCNQCGAPVKLSIPADDTHERHICTRCGFIQYQNPRIIVGCLPVWEGKILIAKRAIEPQYGKWTLPAGFMENAETLEEGAARETKEETGAIVKVDYLQAMFSLKQVNQVYALFKADMQEAQFHSTAETLECKLVTPDEIPWDKLAFRAIEFALKSYINDIQSGNKTTHVGEFTGDRGF